MHWPSEHVWPETAQLEQVFPAVPHAEGSMPSTHWPLDVQHPVHEPGPQPPA
jgi:hypothetical protein